MLSPAFNKKFLFGTTVMAGFAALTVMSAPAYAQSGAMQTPTRPSDPPAPTPGVVQPNSDDQAEVTQEATAEDAVEPGAAEGDVEAVVVTGSRIRRDPTNAPTPLIQLNREAILQSGEPSIVDFLSDVPALQASLTPADTTGGFLGIGGLSLLNLRNLGSTRTLVLVDGRRHVGGQPGTAAVDVDTIPSALIENVEIITGAASSVYGADAVSGVVNFILRKNFEGIEVDAGVGQLSQGTDALSRRASILVGRNFLDDRLNIYGFAEYSKSDPVFDNELDIGYLNRDERLIEDDRDPSTAPEDGDLDNKVIGGLRSFNRPRFGVVVLANNVQPSPAADPDREFSSAAGFNTIPGVTYVFDAAGNARIASFGTFSQRTGLNQTLTNSPDAEDLLIVDVNRYPEQEARRFQTGFNFDITDSIQAFGEYKYVEETNLDRFQPGFANVTIRAFAPGESPDASALTSFSIGLDNAFLPENLRQAILTNQRTTYNAAGQVTGTVADPRAQLRFFTFDLGLRPSFNTREVNRYVLGLRGDRDKLFFIDNFAWEVGYTKGVVEDVDVQPETIDQERLSYSLDAVRDVNNVTGKGVNAIVCRVQLLVAQGLPVRKKATTNQFYSASDPAIKDCVPGSVFGAGNLAAARPYLLASLTNTNRNEQEDALAFVSGEILEGINPAGGIGIALGTEYRKETFVATIQQFDNRIFFGNAGQVNPEKSFDVQELFGEVRVPILKDLPFVQLLELTGAYRKSEYSNIGAVETKSILGVYRPSRDLLFRASYGQAIRAPNLADLFGSTFDTFPNITDPCSKPVIDATTDPVTKANRIKNCGLLGIPTNYVDPFPGFSNQGKSGSNPNLVEEQSDSYTGSVVITPRFIPNFSMVLDYYDIKITNAIQTLGIQTVVNLCTDQETLNPLFCSAVPRRPAGTVVDGVLAEFEIFNFIQGPFNFAALRARGMDFNAKYRLDLADLDFLSGLGSDLGRLDFSLTGNYLIRRQNFSNPVNPGEATAQLDATINNPRVRFLTGVTYSRGPIAVTWEVDYQTSQEIIEARNLLGNGDARRVDLIETGSFTQHDFSARYDITDSVRLRAGITNAFDAEPNVQTGIANDNFDLFGRRYFVGLNLRFGAAVK